MYRPPPPPGTFSPAPYGGASPFPQMSPNNTWQRPKTVWKEHTTPEGRKYWYNTMTKQSTWEKPEDLQTPEEKILKDCPWKEYTTPEGKRYYSNVKTKETVWEIPKEYKELLEKARKASEILSNAAPVPAVPTAVPLAAIPASGGPPVADGPPAIRTSTINTTNLLNEPLPEFASKEDAEKAFFKLLKETGVRPDWTWEQTMRAIITKPLYRALKSAAERKAAFQQFIDSEAKREREEREERETKQRSDFFLMLENTKQVKPFTRFRTVIKLCQHLPAFQKTEKREAYFDEFIQGLQRREKERLRDVRKDSTERFGQLLRSLPEITYKTSWREAQSLYKSQENDFEGMDMLDFLAVFEEYNRELWEQPQNELNQKISQRRRRERKAREGFKQLLHELVESNQINVRTLWKDIYPAIKDDPRYHAALGLPESTPLDMFWDVLDDLDEQLYQQKKVVYEALKRADFEVDIDTEFDAYYKALDGINIKYENLKSIFEHLQYKAHYRLKEEKRRQEKRLKKKMDIFRHLLKHLQPPITLEQDTWESVRPRVEHAEEFRAIEDEQAREEVFEKFMKRLKEKKEDEEEEEEGMIKEDEEGMIREDRRHSNRRRRKEYESEGEEERMRRKRKRHISKGGYSSAEEGEALDDYEKDPRRFH